MNRNYESTNIDVNWGPLDISKGWGPDVFLTVTGNEDRVTTDYGSDGQMAASKTANRGARIELTLWQTADVNKAIGAVAALQDKIGEEIPSYPFTINDKTGQSSNFVTLNAILVDSPDTEFGATNGTKTWVWECETFIDGADVSTITEALADYIK